MNEKDEWLEIDQALKVEFERLGPNKKQEAFKRVAQKFKKPVQYIIHIATMVDIWTIINEELLKYSHVLEMVQDPKTFDAFVFRLLLDVEPLNNYGIQYYKGGFILQICKEYTELVILRLDIGNDDVIDVDCHHETIILEQNKNQKKLKRTKNDEMFNDFYKELAKNLGL